MKKIKHKSIKSLRKKLWKLKSEYVRRFEHGICFTCGDTRPWKEQQAGHYIHKDCLDYDEINIHCQCARCNKWLHGNTGVYAERLIAKYGAEKIELLRQKSQQIKKWSVQELEDLIETYKQALAEMQKEA
jgi:hypothetical protein